jgi:hypothetical protein
LGLTPIATAEAKSSGEYSQVSQRTRTFYSTSLVEAAYFEAYHDLPIHRINLASKLNFEAYHRQGPISNARGNPKGIPISHVPEPQSSKFFFFFLTAKLGVCDAHPSF